MKRRAYPALLSVTAAPHTGCVGASDVPPRDDSQGSVSETTRSSESFQRFTIRAEDELTVTVLITEFGSDETVYDRSHSMDAGEELTLEEPLFEGPSRDQPYGITLSMDGESVWERTLEPCQRLRVSIDGAGTINDEESLQGDCPESTPR